MDEDSSVCGEPALLSREEWLDSDDSDVQRSRIVDLRYLMPRYPYYTDTIHMNIFIFIYN